MVWWALLRGPAKFFELVAQNSQLIALLLVGARLQLFDIVRY